MNLARNYESYYSNGSLLYTEGNAKGYMDFETANILNLAGNVISTVRENESDPFDENIYFYSYNKDIRNSTSSVVDDNNSGIVAYEYDDFGNTEIVGDTNFNNEICYTGGIYDKEIGEYYLNARHYDPTTARFTSVDTYRGETEEPLSLHLYAYCANNPVNYVDPSGHLMIDIKLSNYAGGVANRYHVVLTWKSLFHRVNYIRSPKLVIRKKKIKARPYYSRGFSYNAGSVKFGARTLPGRTNKIGKKIDWVWAEGGLYVSYNNGVTSYDKINQHVYVPH